MPSGALCPLEVPEYGSYPKFAGGLEAGDHFRVLARGGNPGARPALELVCAAGDALAVDPLVCSRRTIRGSSISVLGSRDVVNADSCRKSSAIRGSRFGRCL